MMAASSAVAFLLLALVSLLVPPAAADCPTACECSSWLGTYVACRGTEMSEPPLNTYTPSLESLYFTFNKNTVEVRGGELSAAHYSTLRVLILNNNAISRLDTDAFLGLTSLKQLDLSDNDIRVIPHDVFNPIKRLSRLNLSGNKQITLSDKGWNLPRLGLLIMRGCTLDAIPLNFFENMPNLKIIKLDRNKFSQIDANVFRPVIQTLQYLDLSINKFTKLPRGVLEMIPTSVELHLEHNRYNCDCEFQESYCMYEGRAKRMRLPCKTPKKMRGVDGSDVRHLLNCGGNSTTCIAK